MLYKALACFGERLYALEIFIIGVEVLSAFDGFSVEV